MNENYFKFDAIMSSCKYLLPCGRCEMTRRKCTAENPTVIQAREKFKNDGVAKKNETDRCKTNRTC